METVKNGLKKLRGKWHSEVIAAQRHNRISLVSVQSFCQNEFLRRKNISFKSLPAYGYYEKIHKLLSIYEIGGVLSAE